MAEVMRCHFENSGFHLGSCPSLSLGVLALGEASCHIVRQPCGGAHVSELEAGFLRPATSREGAWKQMLPQSSLEMTAARPTTD